jgi:hypothetical protein
MLLEAGGEIVALAGVERSRSAEQFEQALSAAKWDAGDDFVVLGSAPLGE